MKFHGQSTVWSTLVNLLILSAATSGLESTAEPNLIKRGEPEVNLVKWIESAGGYVDHRQVIHSEPGKPRGVYASQDIPRGQLLLILPAETLLGPKYVNDICLTAQMLQQEMNLGKESFYAPFLHYLSETNNLPDNWSEEGRLLLDRILGSRLPPHEIGSHTRWWQENCAEQETLPMKYQELLPKEVLDVTRKLDSRDQEILYAHLFSKTENDTSVDNGSKGLPTSYIQTLTHTLGISGPKDEYTTVVPPYYALYNHAHSRHDSSIRSFNVEDGFHAYASRDIKAGEQITHQYGDLTTPELFREYGFVEQQHQKWSFYVPSSLTDTGMLPYVSRSPDTINATNTIHFDIDFITGRPEVSWVSHGGQPPNDNALLFFRAELQRLRRVKEKALNQKRKKDDSSSPSVVPVNEEESIWRYHRALTTAMESAIAFAVQAEA